MRPDPPGMGWLPQRNTVAGVGRRRRVNRAQRQILWTASFSHGLIHVYELAVPALLLLIQRDFGAGDFTMGQVVTVYGLLFGLGALPSGLLVDRVGPSGVYVRVTAPPSQLSKKSSSTTTGPTSHDPSAGDTMPPEGGLTSAAITVVAQAEALLSASLAV